MIPFVGSGTTLLAAKEMGIPCEGYDLSPLAVLASNTKTKTFSHQHLEASWQSLERTLIRNNPVAMSRTYPELVQKALPDGRLEVLNSVAMNIENVDCSNAEKDFFRLALISIIPHFSYAVANGGWLRWLNQGACAENVTRLFKEQVEMMLSDVL